MILFGGDFTSTALKKEFLAAHQFVKTFEQPWIAIPGNHDHYTYRSFRNKDFYRYFPSALEQSGIEVRQIAPKWQLIALDTSIPTLTSSQGLFSEELEASLEKVLKQISPSDSVLLFNHYPFFQNDSPNRCLRRAQALEALLKRHRNIRGYLHGHTHRHVIADLQSSGLPLVLDSGSSSHKLYGSWNLLDLSDEGCRVTAYHWKGQWKPFRIEHVAWLR